MQQPIALLALTTVALMTTDNSARTLLKRAIDPNPSLLSYVASASLTATLRSPLPLAKTFVGTVYYVRPRRTIVFTNVTGPWSKFKELTAVTPTMEEIENDYTTTLASDDGVSSTFVLLPSKAGRRMKSLSLVIDDGSALIRRAVWAYNNGAVLSVDQSYENIGGFRVPDQESVSADFPGYRADGVLRFSDYRLNAPVPASVFKTE